MTSTTNLNQSQHKTNKQNPLPAGFTIIEVVLVLAIAGLIFLMVFIALPALQRNQRDTQRKNDISHLQDAIERYRANNKGRLPWAVNAAGSQNTKNFGSNYLKIHEGEWSDPSGVPYYLFLVTDTSTGSTPGWVHPGYRAFVNNGTVQNYIFIRVSAKCSGRTFERNDQPNRYALIYALEGGGSVCVDG